MMASVAAAEVVTKIEEQYWWKEGVVRQDMAARGAARY